MASYYVRSGAAGAGTGANWANAYTTLTTAFSGKAAGDIFYVSEDHAESTAGAVTLTSPGTGAAPCFVYCVDHAGTVPPVSADLRTTATVTTTGNSALVLNLNAYVYGIIFSCGSGVVAPTLTINNGALFCILENCSLRSGGTNSSTIQLNNNTAARCELINTSVQFAATGSGISFGNGRALWRGASSTITGATLPTTLVLGFNSAAEITLWGVDLSPLASKTIIANQNSNGSPLLIDCKLGASTTVAATPTSIGGPRTDLIRSDSGATNYRQERYRYEGTLTTETTIVRTGGATDGATPISHKIVSTANSKWVLPFVSFPIAIWNDSTAAITTLTIYGTTTGGGVPNNDDIWVEVEYLGSSLTPQGSFITTTKADNLAAAAATNNSADASTWGGGGAGNGFKIVVPSFTPGQKGPVNITIKVAKASATYYIDPVAYITGQAVSKSFVVAPGVYLNSAGGISRARAFAGFA